MESEILRSDFVLLVCTETYLLRVEQRQEPGEGRGVLWESNLIYNLLYLADTPIQTFIPILIQGGVQALIPLPLRTLTYYYAETDSGYEDLYRHLTAQPRHIVPALGKLRTLPPRDPTGSSSSLEEDVASGSTLQPQHLLPPRSSHFVGRDRELKQIHTKLNRPLPQGTPRQFAIHGQGGFGKTSMAVEYGWRHLKTYLGGVFFIDCNSDYQQQLGVLAIYLGIGHIDPLNLDEVLPLIKQKLESGPPSLLILDNVRDDIQWTGDEFRKYLPAGACRRLITTRARNLPDVEMIAAKSLPVSTAIQLLAKRRPDASKSGNRQVVESVVCWLDGWAVALTIVGLYMSRLPELTWTHYAKSFSGKGLGALVATEDIVGRLPDYRQRMLSVFDDMLATLSMVELRILQYAALLPEDNVYPLWLDELAKRDTELPVNPMPGFEHAGAAAIVQFQSDRLLIKREKGQNVLSLHRLLRQSLIGRIKAEPTTYAHLQASILSLAEDPESERLGKPVARVRWFNPQKGFGFLSVRSGADIFVHISAVERAGLKNIYEGDWLFCEIWTQNGKRAAVGLAPLLTP
jgi:cold shock CspA family protein